MAGCHLALDRQPRKKYLNMRIFKNKKVAD
jgi:hypothetical protein